MKDIAIGIKTFLRDQHLFECIGGIRCNLPDAQMVVADDGRPTPEKDRLYNSLRAGGHVVQEIPFDSGFGAKSNWIADALQRKYLLVGSDDFDFRPAQVYDGIERLQEVLDYFPEVSIASGRVGNRAYEFDLLETRPGEFVEVEIDRTTYDVFRPWFTECDLTVNYSLIRADVFQKVRWGNDVKIGGGEHAAFFIDCMRAGLKTVWVPGVNINELQIRNSREYNSYRNRADSKERPCFKKRAIKKYTLANGQVDYDIESDYTYFL